MRIELTKRDSLSCRILSSDSNTLSFHLRVLTLPFSLSFPSKNRQYRRFPAPTALNNSSSDRTTTSTLLTRLSETRSMLLELEERMRHGRRAFSFSSLERSVLLSRSYSHVRDGRGGKSGSGEDKGTEPFFRTGNTTSRRTPSDRWISSPTPSAPVVTSSVTAPGSTSVATKPSVTED
jgi:hypothetical protein